jgi:mannose-6-phosphate isomerase-like protein (cupin superfamily)
LLALVINTIVANRAREHAHISGGLGMQNRSHYHDIVPYITKDGSKIRELMHPDSHACVNQSIAEATIAVGGETQLHKHHEAEEIYFILKGVGLMQLGEESFNVGPGDTICIQPETLHNLLNTGQEPLLLLCCCSPAYSHADTVLY